MIKVENVSFKYNRNSKLVLNNINIEIDDGETVAIIGQNGSGKSTIGKLISGITKLKEGSITIDGLNINNPKAKEKVGIVFQNPDSQIIFNNIYDELAFSLKGIDKTEIDCRVKESLKLVGMDGDVRNALYSLSLGQKQRITIAEILAKKAKYIVLDEPTTMIDSEGKECIYNIIKKLKKEGYTIILITNVADEILLADRILVLKNGKISYNIKKEELVEKPNILKENGIKEPLLIEIINKLRKNNIPINMKELTVNELIERIKILINNEGHN